MKKRISDYYLGIILLSGIILLIPEVLIAQSKADSSNHTSGWVNTGIGIIKPGKYDSQVGLGISLNLQKRKGLIGLSYFTGTEVLPQSRYDKSNSVSLTYNYIYKKKWWYASGGTGINLLWYKHYGSFNENSGTDEPGLRLVKPGIPIDFRLFFTTRKVGFGLNPGLIFNNEFTAGYFMLSLQFGKNTLPDK